MKVREKKKLDTKNKILAAAIKLFEEKSFETTTVMEIAEKAGVSRGTFFNYFPYKEAVLVEFLSQYLIELGVDVETRYSKENAIEAIYHLSADFAGFAKKHKHLVLPLCFELLNPDRERSKRAFLELPLVPIIKKHMDSARAHGLIRQDYSTNRLAYTLANSIFLTSLHWASYRQHRDIKTELKIALDLTLEGLVCNKIC